MSEVPRHRLYLHYSELPLSTRALYTAVLLVLGLAYSFGGIYLYHTYAGRAGGNPLCRYRAARDATAHPPRLGGRR